MKRLYFCAIYLLAASVLAKDGKSTHSSPAEDLLNQSVTKNISNTAYAPITEFPTGQYLGLGHYVTATNQRGTYSSFADVGPDSFQANYVREYGVGNFSLSFDFNENGFFTVIITEHQVLGDIEHEGYGYCQSVQCHIRADLGNRLFEETVTFATWENKIYRLGSLSNPPYAIPANVIMAWEETMVRVGEHDDLVDEGGIKK